MKKIYLQLLILFVFTSCNSEFDLFEEYASTVAKSGNIITPEEHAELVEIIKLNSSDRKFSKFITADKYDDSKLNTYLQKKGYKVKVASDVTSNNTYVNVYVENSGSMNGYINGNTEFKAAIQDLLVLLKYQYNEDRIKVFFINSDIHQTNISTDLAGFASKLNTTSFKVGDTGSSDLNSVFKQVLAKTSKNTMSILISDCIYSIQGSKTQELLSNQKSLTKDAFLSKSRFEKLATTIIKLTSQFNGNYWDMNNKKTMLTNEIRPYYLAIIGSNDAMKQFNSKIKLNSDKVEGFKDQYTLSSASQNDVFYTIINTAFDNGRFRVSRDRSGEKGIHAIEAITTDDRSRKPFRFSVAIDFSSLPVTESYILDLKNYVARGYKIVGVYNMNLVQDKIKINSKNSLANMNSSPTHIVVIEGIDTNFRNTNLILKKSIPKWVIESSTDNDTGKISNTKTFGFKYLVEGIAEAYEITTNSQSHFDLQLSLKN